MGSSCARGGEGSSSNPAVSVLPPCPHLPPPREGLDWKLLAAHRDAHRGGEFYLDCLEYGHSLWIRGLAARAILCLDRAFGAELTGAEPVVAAWPMPYAALAWMLRFTPPERLVGNPRVHFQHYAGRMNEPRREQRRWRAWAGWALARAVFPALPGDPASRGGGAPARKSSPPTSASKASPARTVSGSKPWPRFPPGEGSAGRTRVPGKA